MRNRGDDHRHVSQCTSDDAYAQRLRRLANVWWKRILPVQAPYRRNVRRLCNGFTLDIGSGAGRNLEHLRGRAVGVDHNPNLVATARSRGLEAYEPEDFLASPKAIRGGFDSLLFSHVLEHMTPEEAEEILATYLPFLRSGGRVIVMTPQERGFAADPTHVAFLDEEAVGVLLERTGVSVERSFSFPFPRWAGRIFAYNEFVTVGELREGSPVGGRSGRDSGDP